MCCCPMYIKFMIFLKSVPKCLLVIVLLEYFHHKMIHGFGVPHRALGTMNLSVLRKCYLPLTDLNIDLHRKAEILT